MVLWRLVGHDPSSPLRTPGTLTDPDDEQLDWVRATRTELKTYPKRVLPRTNVRLVLEIEGVARRSAQRTSTVDIVLPIIEIRIRVE